MQVQSWDNINIPGLGVGYVVNKSHYGVRGKRKLGYYVILHKEFVKEGSGGYFIKEDWVRENEDGLFIDIDQVLLDSFNTTT